MIPIIFTGLSVCIMFSANQFNPRRGGRHHARRIRHRHGGNLSADGSGAAPDRRNPARRYFVGIMMLLPALLKSKLDVSEMVCSLMLNYIVMYLIKFVLNTYLADKSKGQIQSYEFLSRRRSRSWWTTAEALGRLPHCHCGGDSLRSFHVPHSLGLRHPHDRHQPGILEIFRHEGRHHHCRLAAARRLPLPVSAAASRCWADTRPS